MGPADIREDWRAEVLNRHVKRVFNSEREETHWGTKSWRGIGDGYQFVIGLTPIFPSTFSGSLRFLL
jgi:hypothetical protein